VFFTIGHSTHPLDEFLHLLRSHGVNAVADVRLVPRSKRFPHFSIDVLPGALAGAAVAYRHFPQLGGHRRPRADSRNRAWRNESFQGYADYMQTAAFEGALGELVEWGKPPRVAAIMCAEAVWWRCHRQLIADVLTARGIEVRHVMSLAAPGAHRLSEFARVTGERVEYPALL
jgi:uncharacterized protein (DUF488 family)